MPWPSAGEAVRAEPAARAEPAEQVEPAAPVEQVVWPLAEPQPQLLPRRRHRRGGPALLEPGAPVRRHRPWWPPPGSVDAESEGLPATGAGFHRCPAGRERRPASSAHLLRTGI